MSEYHKALLSVISNSTKWPAFARPDFINTLDTAGHDAFQKQTLEGYLAAFLIFQQISEDMVKNIIKLGRLYNQATVFPLEIEYESIDKMTFGVLLKELRLVPHYERGSALADLCGELNVLRIQLVHKITLKESLKEIKEKCQFALEIFGKIENIYEELEDSYRMVLSDSKDSAEEWKREYSELFS